MVLPIGGTGNTVEAPKRDKAVQWLRETLTGRTMATTEIDRLAKEADIKPATLRQAKKELGIVSFPLTQPDGKRGWFVRIPEDALNKDDKQV